jgi:hypothetical protein
MLGGVLHGRKPDEAVALLAPAEAAFKQAFAGGNEALVGRALAFLGKARTAIAKGPAELAVAEQNLQEAWSIASRPGGAAKDKRQASMALAELYTAWDRFEPGARAGKADQFVFAARIAMKPMAGGGRFSNTLRFTIAE